MEAILKTSMKPYQSIVRGTGSEFYDLAWSPDGDYLIVASIDNTARIYDIKTCKRT